MANAIDSYRWIYPPNWNEVYPNADELGSPREGTNKAILQVTHYFDAATDLSEDDLGPLNDLTNFRGPQGLVCKRLCIERIYYQIFGVNVTLLWKRVSVESPYDVITNIGSTGVESNGCVKGPFVDPGYGDGTDGNGGVVITTVDAAAKDTLELTLHLKFKETPMPNRPTEVQL